jgi:hypothetical protein
VTAKDYHRKYGVQACRELADRAGTNYEYFRQIVHGQRSPSRKMALKLIEADRRRPGLTFTALMLGE